MQKILLIGGSNDGKWIDIEKLEKILAVPVVKHSTIRRLDGEPVPMLGEPEQYIPLMLKAGEIKIIVYKLEGLTDGDVFKRLILYYRPTPTK